MANRMLVEGQIVALEKDVSEIDSYGRLLATRMPETHRSMPSWWRWVMLKW